MDLPPDPYLALGLPKDATQAAVKTAHRKLVLKCHPDKVADPDAKQAAADQFHKIQTAYEILIDEDRRARYDAQVRLASLRKEAMESRPSGGASRSASTPYRSSREETRPSYTSRASERMAPQYEERRPSYAAADYFDVKPRSSSARKEPEYERPSKRSEPKEKPRSSARESKDSERERRKEKARKSDRETRKERESKHTAYVASDSDSDSDEYARRPRRVREEDDLRKSRDAYAHHDDAYRPRREATAEPHDAYARKMQEAREHISSRGTRPRADPMEEFPRSRPRTELREESPPRSRPRTDAREDFERRPSAARMASTKDKLDYVKGVGRDGRPVVVRRGSERPKPKDAEPPREPLRSEYSHYSPRQEPERRSSAEKLADRRPPPLNTSKSSPTDIRIPVFEKPRSQSVQIETENAPRISPIKRAETMPHNIPRAPESTVPLKGSNLRQTEFSEGLATPATTPDNATPPANKYNYGKQYADDAEYPTPDGYRTEVREPVLRSRPAVTRRFTRSPSPAKESREPHPRDPPGSNRRELPREVRDVRDRPSRTSSARYPSSPMPAMAPRTTSYVYSGPGQGVSEYNDRRPSMPRAESSRLPTTAESLYYGEIPTTSSKASAAGIPPRHRASVVDEGISYRKPVRHEDVRMQAGYSTSKRPGLSGRSGSGYGVKA